MPADGSHCRSFANAVVKVIAAAQDDQQQLDDGAEPHLLRRDAEEFAIAGYPRQHRSRAGVRSCRETRNSPNPGEGTLSRRRAPVSSEVWWLWTAFRSAVGRQRSRVT